MAYSRVGKFGIQIPNNGKKLQPKFSKEINTGIWVLRTINNINEGCDNVQTILTQNITGNRPNYKSHGNMETTSTKSMMIKNWCPHWKIVKLY